MGPEKLSLHYRDKVELVVFVECKLIVSIFYSNDLNRGMQFAPQILLKNQLCHVQLFGNVKVTSLMIK